MTMPNRYELIASGSAGDNAAGNSGVVNTQEYDSLIYRVVLVGGAAPAGVTLGITGYTSDGVTTLIARGGTVTTAVVSFDGSWGPGCSSSSGGGPVIAGPVPGAVRLTYNPFGVGISTTWTIYGRRGHRGPDVHSNAD